MSDKYAALKQAAQEEIMCRESGDTSDAWQDEASPEFILELLAERDADKARIADQREVMRQAAADIAYAIFNLTGADISRLSPGVVESTDPTDTALIAERNLRAAAGISLKIEGK